MTDLSTLSKFAEGKPKPFTMLRQEDLAEGMVMSYDQSLAATGWALVTHSEGHAEVEYTGTLKNTGDPLSGSDAVLARAAALEEELVEHWDQIRRQIRSRVRTRGLVRQLDVVYERPPASGHASRPESSLLAAREILRVAGLYPVSVVAAQHTKKVLTGNGNAKKPEVKSALLGLGWLYGKERARNEHERDAVANALTHLYDRKNP